MSWPRKGRENIDEARTSEGAVNGTKNRTRALYWWFTNFLFFFELVSVFGPPEVDGRPISCNGRLGFSPSRICSSSDNETHLEVNSNGYWFSPGPVEREQINANNSQLPPALQRATGKRIFMRNIQCIVHTYQLQIYAEHSPTKSDGTNFYHFNVST